MTAATLTPPSCACGCGQPVRKRDGHWNTYLKGHARKGKSSIGYEIDAGTGCWVWQGATIRRLLATGMLQKHIAERVGVHRRLVSHVNCGQTWVGVGE